MSHRSAAFSLVDLLAGCAMVFLLLIVVIPGAGRVREISKRSVCSVNLAGIGAACKVFAETHAGFWPVPCFRESIIDQSGIDYLLPNNGIGERGQIGYRRTEPTTSGTLGAPDCPPGPDGPVPGSTQVSVTRAYWMLVRSGDVVVKQFVCPSNPSEIPDSSLDIDSYYDFAAYRHISYGYQVPFGPPNTRPSEALDNRQAVAADKGPWYLESSIPEWRSGPGGNYIDLDDPPSFWRPFNSPNHGGFASGEGQNVLFPDGYVTFVRTPTVGVDSDNIYTLMTRQWSAFPFNLIHGDTPHEAANPPYPGQNAFGIGAGRHAATDSLIYP
jgi:hypothetical protein